MFEYVCVGGVISECVSVKHSSTIFKIFLENSYNKKCCSSTDLNQNLVTDYSPVSLMDLRIMYYMKFRNGPYRPPIIHCCLVRLLKHFCYPPDMEYTSILFCEERERGKTNLSLNATFFKNVRSFDAFKSLKGFLGTP